MSNLLFVIGQIRTLESQLLSSNQLDRMVGAKTPLDAFRVMTELSYAQYFDESTKPEDFETILEQGLIETKQKIVEGTENHPGLFFIWGLADLNNLKMAFKLRFVQNAKEISDFSQSAGFSLLGDLSQEELEKIVFQKIVPEKYPDEIASQITQIEELWKNNSDILEVECFLNTSYFEYFHALAQKLKIPFLEELYLKMVDLQNIKSLARYILLRESPLPKKYFLSHGTFVFDELKKISNADAFFRFLKKSRFSDQITFEEGASHEENLLELEQSLEKTLLRFIKWGQSGEINSIQVPIAYFHKRLQDAKKLKCIMFSKFQGIKSEDIYQTLKTLSL